MLAGISEQRRVVNNTFFCLVAKHTGAHCVLGHWTEERIVSIETLLNNAQFFVHWFR